MQEMKKNVLKKDTPRAEECFLLWNLRPARQKRDIGRPMIRTFINYSLSQSARVFSPEDIFRIIPFTRKRTENLLLSLKKALFLTRQS